MTAPGPATVTAATVARVMAEGALRQTMALLPATAPHAAVMLIEQLASVAAAQDRVATGDVLRAMADMFERGLTPVTGAALLQAVDRLNATPPLAQAIPAGRA